MPVRLLPDKLINQIAAGEVVERPASVVKELLENALDAEATVVRVELRGGGRGLIRVVDNGSGMSKADALNSLERHATSKIATLEDLAVVSSLGFRGEAVPSIASVSRFSMLTRRAGDDVGTKIVVDGGVVKGVEAAGAVAGTEITARSLFFNVPARRKFLRTARTELSHCVDVVARQALVLPEVDFEVIHDGRTVLRAPAVTGRALRVRALLGPEASRLIEFESSKHGFTVRGFVSPVGVHRSTQKGASYLYVNGRYLRDQVMRRGILEAYRGLVPKGRYPVVVIEVLVEPSRVDVNAHPAKLEVRFRDPRDLIDAVTTGVREALAGQGIERPVPRAAAPAAEGSFKADSEPPMLFADNSASAPKPTFDELSAVVSSIGRQSEGRIRETSDAKREGEGVPMGSPEASQMTRGAGPSFDGRGTAVFVPHAKQRGAETTENSVEAGARSTSPVLPVDRFADLRVIGQLDDSYLLCEGAGELVIVDQHAAHERVNLARMTANLDHHLGQAQGLLTPTTIEMSRARAALLQERPEVLERLKLAVTPVGLTQFVVTAVPAFLLGVDLTSLLTDLADELAPESEATTADDIIEKFISTLACHSSVRAKDDLSLSEMRSLLKSLDEVDFQVCAHGRPVILCIDKTEIERRFHRS